MFTCEDHANRRSTKFMTINVARENDLSLLASKYSKSGWWLQGWYSRVVADDICYYLIMTYSPAEDWFLGEEW